MTSDQQTDIVPPALEIKEKKRRMLRKMALGLVTAGLIAGVLAYWHYRAFESTDDAFIDGRYTVISPRVSGYVARIHAKDNQWVYAGDLLAELDPADYEAKRDAAQAALDAANAAYKAKQLDITVTTMSTQALLNEARAGLDAAQASVESAKAQLELAQNGLVQAQAEVSSAKAVHDRDAVDLKRYTDMAQAKVVSQQSYEHMVASEAMSSANLISALKNVETKKAMIRQAEASLKAAISNRVQAEARLASARSGPEKVAQSQSHSDMSAADVKRAEAELEQARLNLSYTRITAPADGFVTRKNIAVGQLAQAGQSLLSLVPKAVWVTANFKETQVSSMHPGQRVEITVDTYPNQPFAGRVDSLQRGTGSLFSLLPPENATGNFVKVVQRIPVKIVFEPEARLDDVTLTPGMSVTADVYILPEDTLDPPSIMTGSNERNRNEDGA